jgi:IS4 transposase
MNSGRLIFSQLMDFLPMHDFRKCVERYDGNKGMRSFSCLDQFLCMAFAQLTYRESLRDIEACLRAIPKKRYHMGIKGSIARSTIAEANERRDWRIYADFAQRLISHARDLYAEDDFGLELDETVYALDSTTIDLCLELFPWATFRTTKAAVKLHTLLDLRGSIPSWAFITNGKVHDVNILDYLVPEPGSFYVMDRGYLDFARLYQINLGQAFFVVRAKTNTKYQRQYSHPVDRSCGLICDQTGLLTGFYAAQDYPDKLRRVKFHDREIDKSFVFLTNNFTLPALIIAQIYKCRWKVELFFKWIKQHLRIKAFFGTSENAVKTQIWIAIAVYVLVAIMKKRLMINLELYTILQILSLTLFEKSPLLQTLTHFDCTSDIISESNQMFLFMD